jgi:aminoglycoside/choline kinase family phosphotransferase
MAPLIKCRILHEPPLETATLERLAQLRSWLAARAPGRNFELAPASSDASFRRYFRAT